jgi:hypothetical protein
MQTSQVKPFDIPKQLVWEAYRQVAANKGAPGVDGVDLEAFEARLKGNLYVIWNRMSSGSYFPPPVRAVEIPITTTPWVLLYVKRWLEAPLQLPDGTLKERDKGPPKAQRFRLSWLSFSCTMRSTNGCPGTSRAAPSNAV